MAALTYANLKSLVTFAAQGVTATEIDTAQTVNEAGRYLCDMHDWNWLERPATAVNLVASQDYVTLPTDFSKLLSVVAANTTNIRVIPATLDYIRRLRSSPATTFMTWWYALEYPTQASATASAANARLAIYPTPGANQTAALYVTYRAGWTELSSDTSVPNMPVRMESLLTELVRAFALGKLDDQRGEATLTMRLENIENSQMVKRLKESFGSDQWNLGESQGGAVQQREALIFRPFTHIYAGGETP